MNGKALLKKVVLLKHFSNESALPHIKPFHRIIAGDQETATQIMTSEEDIVNVVPFSVEKIKKQMDHLDNGDLPGESIGYVIPFSDILDENTINLVNGILSQGRSFKTYLCIYEFTFESFEKIKKAGVSEDVIKMIMSNCYDDVLVRQRQAFKERIEKEVDELFAEFQKELDLLDKNKTE